MSPLAVWSLARREWVRFIRQPSRIGSAVASPLLFWVLIGAGLSSSFHMPGGGRSMSFLEYFYPGTVVLLILFGSIFSTISVIEDRHEGFLQGVLVAPIGRSSLVAGKVLGGSLQSLLPAALLLPLAPLVGVPMSWLGGLAAVGILALLSVALTALGFAIAWKVDSTQGFHAVMNMLLWPLWLLSGAVFPLTGAPRWLAVMMEIDPMTYGVAAFRRVLYGPGAALGEGLPRGDLSILGLVLIAAAAFWLADVIAHSHSGGRS
jgi:ABC-2 type transport system permease protein